MIEPSLPRSLHQPVVDLMPAPNAEYFSNAAAVSARCLLDGAAPSDLWIQRRNPPGFRRAILRDTDQGDEGIDSAPWRVLQERLSNWQRLDPATKIKVCRVLLQLGEHERLDALLGADPCLGYEPRLQLQRIIAVVGLFRAGHLERLDAKPMIEQCQRLAMLGATPIAQRTAAGITAFLLALQYVEDSMLCERLYRSLLALESDLRTDGAAFDSVLLRSCIWRAAAMRPHSNGDMVRMRDQMDRAEALAIEARASNQREAFLRHENFFSVYESRTKETSACGDLDSALMFAQRLVDLFPTTAAARIELGEVLLKRGACKEAAAQYALAAGYGPCGRALAWFMAGECFALCDEDDCAVTCYLQSQRYDGLAISALQRIADRSFNTAPLAAAMSWSHSALLELNGTGGRNVHQ